MTAMRHNGGCPRPWEVRLPSGRAIWISCKRRTCSYCGTLWAGDQRVRLLANLDAYGGPIELLTITAPGKDVLGADADGRVPARPASAWNRQAPAQWSELNRRVRQRARRGGRRPPNRLASVWAFQRRGVLHLHVVFGAATAWERAANRAYLAELRAGAAYEWGFGFVRLDRAREGSGRALSRYLAKYLTKHGEGGGLELAETVRHRDCPARPVYVAVALTLRTRATMRNLRLRRYFWHAAASVPGSRPDCDYAEDLWLRGIRVTAGRLRRPPPSMPAVPLP